MNDQERAGMQHVLRTITGVLDRSTLDTRLGTIVIPGPTYLGMWARDTAMICLGLIRLGKLDLAKDLLCRYWAFQIAPDSDPRTFVFRNKQYAAWTEADAYHPTRRQLAAEAGAFPTCVYMRTPDFPAGTREIYGDRADPDSTAWMIIVLHDYAVQAGNIEVLKELSSGVSSAVKYLRSRDPDRDHLLEQGPNQDWADTLLRSGKVAYTQAVWLRCLGAAGQIFELLGDGEQAAACLKEAEDVRRAINRILMTPHGYYANFVAGDHVSMRRSLDTALLIAFGACDQAQGLGVLEVLSTLDGPFGPAIIEPGYSPDALGPSKYPPGQYHNEGVWPWIGAYLALAWARAGEGQRARDTLRSLVTAESDTTYEWVDGVSGEKHHPEFATAAGALAWAMGEAGLIP